MTTGRINQVALLRRLRAAELDGYRRVLATEGYSTLSTPPRASEVCPPHPTDNRLGDGLQFGRAASPDGRLNAVG